MRCGGKLGEAVEIRREMREASSMYREIGCNDGTWYLFCASVVLVIIIYVQNEGILFLPAYLVELH